MRYPLDSVEVTGPFREVAVPGTGLPDSDGVKRHIGVDFHADIDTKVFAPGDGVITASYTYTDGLQVIEARIAGKLWRFLHLSRRDVAAGDGITEGQLIGLSGDSGNVDPHLHVDVRKDGTAWTDSLENFYDCTQLITEGDDMIEDNEACKLLIRIISSEVKGWNFADVHSGKFDKREMDFWKGKSIVTYIQDAWNESEAFRNRRVDALDYYDNTRPKLEAQLAAAIGGVTKATVLDYINKNLK